MKLALAIIALIAACKQEPPAVCTALADKEWSCHPRHPNQGERKENSTDDRLCADAFESEVPEKGVERLGMLRFKHDATCAKSSATCDAYEQCKDRFDLAAAVRD